MTPGGVPNNKVSTQDFYKALLENKDEMKAMEDRQSEKRDDMERRLSAKLECLPRIEQQIKTNEDEIDKLRNRSNWLDLGLGMFTVVMAAISNAFGTRQ